MLNDISYFCALGISWSIYWFLREPVELAEKQTIPAWEWLVLFSVVFVAGGGGFSVSATFLWGYVLVQRCNMSQTSSMLWLWTFFFFQILHKFSNYAGRWPFPRMGMIPLGGNILYWQGNLLPLYTYITEEQNLLSMQQNNTWTFTTF